ncbi:kinase-like domain-containing protein [Roridomyces roridus]|uniref:Kinase-like domain-containing protein n=1 Tax=Roridomyces roridus TaxID=1738132 RepID=A0AAD7CKN8_9AGAR|nr:kinase-like domain-containing protein [Roridomyces roridus]
MLGSNCPAAFGSLARHLSSTKQPRLLNALRQLSSQSKLYPRCFPLPHLSNSSQIGGGGFSDVYVASLDDRKVAVKKMRVFGETETEIEMLEQAFSKEAITWRQLSHPNVLPFYGLFKDGVKPCLVSPWMENGHIRKFLNTRREAYGTDQLLSLILDIALGLEYLHEQKIIHADLKSDNILVTPALKACIADFGLSKVASTLSSMGNLSRPYGTTAVHYKAPELHEGEKADSRSDIYSLACLIYEILMGEPPFLHLPSESAVIYKVMNGQRPECPPSGCRSEIGEVNALWRLVKACWAQSPDERPTAAQVVQALKGTGIRAQETEPAWNWDPAPTSRFRRQLEVARPLPSLSKLRTMV